MCATPWKGRRWCSHVEYIGMSRTMMSSSWSIENVGYNLPTLVSTLQGNLYELSQFTGLKLMDLEVPQSFASATVARRRKYGWDFSDPSPCVA